MGVPFQVYSPMTPLQKNINLILVSADKAKFKTWREHLTEFNQTLPVTRLVFDEAHLPLISDDFRESMRNLGELRQFAMQLILLSATIPPSSISAVKKAFGLLETTAEIRESSNRPELQYIIKERMMSCIMERQTVKIVKMEMKNWTKKDRGLVFVTYLDDGKSLAESVSTKPYLAYMYANTGLDWVAVL